MCVGLVEFGKWLNTSGNQFRKEHFSKKNTHKHQLTHFYKQSKNKQNGFQKRQTRALFQWRI